MTETLYLVCGLLSDEAVWAEQVGVLSETHDVRIAKFPGFDSIPKMAEFLLRDAPERFSIAGHSMGGRVALEVFRSAGERIDKLALLDTGTYPAHDGEQESRQVLTDLARARGMKAMAEDQWIPSIIHPDRLNDQRLVNTLSEMAQKNTVDQFANQISALLSRPDMREVLHRINCETLVCCGRQDAWASVNQHTEMASMISGARLEIIEHSGHMVMMEKPQAFSDVLLDWLLS